MVAVEEIVDRDTFKAWLEEQPEEDRSEIAVTLAMRSAARVFPIWASVLSEDWTHQRDLTAIATCRAILLSAVVDKLPHSDIWRFAGEAADAGYEHGAFVNAVESEGGTVSDVIYAAASAADAKASYDSAFEATFYAENVYPDVWSVLQHDIRASDLQHNLSERRLWPERMPFELADAWKITQSWLKKAPGHDFFLRWYSALLEGRPMTGDWDSHWKMLEEIALIDPKDWDKGDTSAGAVELAAIIAEIEKPYAVKMTASNEQLVVDAQTGLLQLQPVVPLSSDFGRYVRRKLGKALKVFGNHPGNQHTAILPELNLLRETIEDAENLPVEIYDGCTSVLARVAARIKDGELPAEDKDALIADFLKHVRETGAEIFAEDGETQKAIARRNKVTPNDVLIPHRDALMAVAQRAAQVAQPGLLQKLPAAADAALDSTKTKDERHAKSFKLVGRIIRVLRFTADTVAKILQVPKITQDAIQAYRWLVSDPQVQTVWNLVLQFLGLA
ncbi:hypothetical protein [Epibacterium ulvae]|uniref:hypothetical protein n=1 Tax=Epibacterium ulvae TaxID=1156985 RepID=UPI002491D60C|nr:hypothetical protein [Epibacterium ulvae]